MRVAERAWARMRTPAAGWWGPIGVGLLALVLRVWHLGRPDRLMFDETYYAKEGFSLFHYGYARRPVDGANDLIADGWTTGLFTDDPAQIMHPDGGRWLIGSGIEVFGLNSFGWRIAAAVAGALTVFLLARLVVNLTGSTITGTLAGVFLAFDGLHFTMSRIAMLDVFLTFWLIAAIGCLAADRKRIVPDRAPAWIRPWQLAAGLCFGFAVGTKWSGVYVLAAFGLAFVVWEVGLRTDMRGRWVARLMRIGLPAFARIVGVAGIAYLLTWSAWLANAEEYEEAYGDVETWGSYIEDDERHIGQSLRSLANYHQHRMWAFHTGDYIADQEHNYQSHPVSWPLMIRPVTAHADFGLPADECGAEASSECVAHITLAGNPAIWWAGAASLLFAAVAWARTRRWAWGVPVLGFLVSWLPWFASADRPIFSFYAVAMVPFTVMALAMTAQTSWGWATRRGPRTAGIVGGSIMALTAVAIALFVYLWPVLTGEVIARSQWQIRMLLGSWV